MRPIHAKLFCFFFLALTCTFSAFSQSPEGSANAEKKEKDSASKKIKLFKEEEPLEMTLTTDVRQFLGEKEKAQFQKATVSMKLPDGSQVTENIELRARGNFRRDFCSMPSVMLNFKTPTGGKTASIGKLKMVCTCRPGKEYEQLVFKEFLAYKMYNLLDDKSFKVRLVRVNFLDSEGKKKPFQYYGFVIEDVDDMAKRNECRELDKKNVHSEMTDRQHMTLVNLFQYMIGNTDWSVPTPHNIKLIESRDSLKRGRPYAIPYDFDYSGIVNASYAVPDEMLGTTSVTERVYRGFPRTMGELETEATKFKQKKAEIYAVVNGFALLEKREKDGMVKYLNEFYRIIENPKSMQNEFIDNARKQ